MGVVYLSKSWTHLSPPLSPIYTDGKLYVLFYISFFSPFHVDPEHCSGINWWDPVEMWSTLGKKNKYNLTTPSLLAFCSYSPPNVSAELWHQLRMLSRSTLHLTLHVFFLEFNCFCENNIVLKCGSSGKGKVKQLFPVKALPDRSSCWASVDCVQFFLPVELVVYLIYEKLNLVISVGNDKPSLELRSAIAICCCVLGLAKMRGRQLKCCSSTDRFWFWCQKRQEKSSEK